MHPETARTHLAEFSVLALGAVNVNGALVQAATGVEASHHEAGLLGLAHDHHLCHLILVLL